MMLQFTKGKWFFYWYHTKAEKHKRIKVAAGVKVSEGAIKSIAKVSGTNVEAEANARLIAEAPVMYDLLNKTFHILGKNAVNDTICREIDECLSRVDGCPSEHKYTPTLTAASVDMYNLLKEVQSWFHGENSAQVFILNDVKALLDSIVDGAPVQSEEGKQQ